MRKGVWDTLINRLGSLPWLGMLAAACLVLGSAAIVFGVLRGAIEPSWQDTQGYLGHALYIKDHGGVLGFLREAFTGRYPIVQRHPLYMLVLQPLASPQVSFFWQAKLVNLVIGTVSLITLMWMFSKRYGLAVALISGALYGVSRSLVVASAHVSCEPLLTLCALWVWWWLTSGTSAWRWALGGLWAGLAFLTKGSGTLLIAGVVLAALWSSRGRALLRRPLWAFVAATVLVASPLVVRNVLRYGTPLYEGITNHSIWFDQWSDIGDDRSIVSEDRYAILTVEVDRMPTLTTYLKTHSLAQIARRCIGGILREFGIARDALAVAFPVPDALEFSSGLTLLLLLCAGLGLWRSRSQWEGTLLLTWCAIFAVFFAWYSKVIPDIRFLVPVAPFVIGYAVRELWALLARTYSKTRALGMAIAVSLALVGVGVASVAVEGALTAPQPVAAMSPAYQRLIAWINDQLGEGDTILHGPTSEFHGFLWLVHKPIRIIAIPNVRTLEAFLRYLDQRHVTHLVIHPENVRAFNQQLGGAFTPYWSVAPDGQIEEHQRLPGWELVYTDPGTPRRFYVYRHVSHSGTMGSQRVGAS